MTHLKFLIELKLIILKNSFLRLKRRSRLELAVLILFFLSAAALLFLFFFQSFRFFRGQEPFGPILLDETFCLFNFALFIMLFISSAVSSYTALFRSGEVAFLLTRPVRWPEIYFLKLLESLWYSSWSFLFIALPFMAAYSLAKSAGVSLFSSLCIVFYIPFVVLAGTLGTLAAAFAVWLLPSRGRRRFALVTLLLIFGILFIRVEPEVVKEQGTIAGVISGYLPHVAFAKHPLLPSSWTTRGILALSNLAAQEAPGWREGVFYFLLLLANALFFLIPSFSAAARLYPETFLKAQDHGEVRTARRARGFKVLQQLLDRLPWPSKPALAFLEKDIKIFVRDPAEWSQLIIFFGLLLLYFLNLKNFQFHVLKTFWKNLVFVLNTVGTYIVLSSFNMRFVFPMLSLEGSKSWMIGLAPIRFSSPLLEKFFLGTAFSILLTLPLVFLSGWMLEIEFTRVIFTTGLGFFVCAALTGLSVGFGARFPNFKSTNPSEIISGFGGSMLLMAHLAYLALIGVFLILSREPHGLVFATIAAASLLVGTIPLKIGVNALERMEF